MLEKEGCLSGPAEPSFSAQDHWVWLEVVGRPGAKHRKCPAALPDRLFFFFWRGGGCWEKPLEGRDCGESRGSPAQLLSHGPLSFRRSGSLRRDAEPSKPKCPIIPREGERVSESKRVSNGEVNKQRRGAEKAKERREREEGRERKDRER